MSYSWSFQSFSDGAFRGVFGRSPPEQVGEFLESAAAGLGGPHPEIARASRAMLTSRISYEGVSPDDARAMDEVLKFAFSPEGLGARLEVEHLSPDGVHPSVIAELVGRLGAPAPLLRYLVRGRRFGQAAPADCGYCIFGPDEVTTVLEEVRAARAAAGPWSAEYLPELLEECLVEPFEAAEREGRPLFCHLG